MAFQPTPADISVIITNAAFSRTADAEPRFVTERRITPTWTVMQLKGKLETMTGVPPGCQRLLVKVPGRSDQWADEEDRAIGDWGLAKGSEIVVGLAFFDDCLDESLEHPSVGLRELLPILFMFWSILCLPVFGVDLARSCQSGSC